ncbi:B12-binding domain-containing radical SAM protein [candidate division CSSED10-310 bacterium]|uniref:B12-binding domain-containing radical SAM protein n=1 Tax=candidate division CSSED10-310 bacterium TaxID=2855610 RepID=A0ABV6YTG3_UNCC1
MLDNSILLTTPTKPYPTLPANDSLTDATGQRFTKGDSLFTIISHTHCFANHILAQNIDNPAILLEYPSWEDFTAEVDKGYPVIGISAFPVHLDNVMKMCEYIRRRSPATKILLGSYGGQAFEAQYDSATQKRYVDHVVHGEGVKFLRKLLGQDTKRPIQQKLMPRAGGSLPFLTKYPKGAVGFLVSGLGCPGGCDFCATTALFDQQRIELLSPDELVDHIHQYHKHFPEVSHIFVIEEDHFRFPQYLLRLKEYWDSNPEVSESLDWLAFGSIDHIGQFGQKYGWHTLAEIGMGAIFIGVESKFAGEHGYDKRAECNPKFVFNQLHSMGIRTLGAWICGWDFHNHNNIHEDLNYFVSLYPTYQQLTRLSPFPGTKLWEKLREEGRVKEVPWEDVHFWSGAQENTVLEEHETLNLTEYGYDLLYRTWGPSILRRLDIQLNGYAFCMKSENPIMRRHKSIFFKRQCSMFWALLYAIDRFAPNGVVRRRVRKIDEKYRRLIGQPTGVMETLARAIEVLASVSYFKELFDPANRYPKEEPFKRYTYDKHSTHGDVPYLTEWPTPPSITTRLTMTEEELQYAILSKVMKVIRFARPSQSDPLIDEYLINLFHTRAFGFGF